MSFTRVGTRAIARAGVAVPTHVTVNAASRDDALQIARSSLGSSNFDLLASITEKILHDPLIFERLQQIGEEAAREQEQLTEGEDVEARIRPGCVSFEEASESDYVTLDSVLGIEEPPTPREALDSSPVPAPASLRSFVSDLVGSIACRASSVSETVRDCFQEWAAVMGQLIKSVGSIFRSLEPPVVGAEVQDVTGKEVAHWTRTAAALSGALLAVLIVMRCPPSTIREFARVMVVLLKRIM